MCLGNFDDVVAALSRGDAVKLNTYQVRALIRRFPNAAPFISTEAKIFKLDLLPEHPKKLLQKVSEKASPRNMRPESEKILDGLLTRLDLMSHRKSAVAELLRQRALESNQRRMTDKDLEGLHRSAQLLDDCVKRWIERRLWSINLAPELVAHDERHVAAVEANIASLIEPFWLGRNNRNCSFSPDELIWLSIAAWLHDWGHVGGPIMPYRLGEHPVFVSHTVDVRNLHGLISQCLMSPQWKGMHGLEQHIAAPAAILCAHHQSWSSFDDAVPETPEPMKRLQLGAPPSLRANWNRLPEDIRPSLTFERLQFLVALLRVADGADMGCHRVADRGPARGSFLGRCLYREALRTMELAESSKASHLAREKVVKTARDLVIVALSAGQSGLESDLSKFEVDTQGEELLVQLNDYKNFLIKQFEFYDKHAAVRTVHFEYTSSGRFNVVVCPSDAKDGTMDALQTVAKDVRSELDQSSVRSVLRHHHFIFVDVRTPEWFDNPKSLRIDGDSENG